MNWEKTPQTLSNHGRIVPPFHYGLSLVVLVLLGWSIWRLVGDPSVDRAVMVVLALGFAGLFWYTRVFALAAQDRVIRLEMRLRLAGVLPPDLAPRVGELTTGQLIALRFASDAELPQLVRRVLDGELTSRKAIKQAIENWQPDYQRV